MRWEPWLESAINFPFFAKKKKKNKTKPKKLNNHEGLVSNQIRIFTKKLVEILKSKRHRQAVGTQHIKGFGECISLHVFCISVSPGIKLLWWNFMSLSWVNIYWWPALSLLGRLPPDLMPHPIPIESSSQRELTSLSIWRNIWDVFKSQFNKISKHLIFSIDKIRKQQSCVAGLF